MRCERKKRPREGLFLGPDHWFLSLIYALIGFDKYQEDLASIVSTKNMFSNIPIAYQEDKLNSVNMKIIKSQIIRGEEFNFNG